MQSRHWPESGGAQQLKSRNNLQENYLVIFVLMDSPVSWSSDVLARVLHFLAADGCEKVWGRLSFLTLCDADLSRRARSMARPLVLRANAKESSPGPGHSHSHSHRTLAIPFRQASIVQIDIDWGDDSPLEYVAAQDAQRGYVEHKYQFDGDYWVRIWPHGDGQSEGISSTWLDHLGWGREDRIKMSYAVLLRWGQLVSSIATWGSLGIRSLSGLFLGADSFNEPLPTRGLEKIVDMSYMFDGAVSFNQPISSWDVGAVRTTARMFYNAASFNQPIDNWNVSNVTDMTGMFSKASSFNCTLASWSVKNVTQMDHLFDGASKFTHHVGNWDVSNVVSMCFMFQDVYGLDDAGLGAWDVSRVTKMNGMFSGTRFNQPIGNWNVSNVTEMSKLFYRAPCFNQPLGNWDVRNVTDMSQMFWNAFAFNQPIGDWNVRNVRNMDEMFHGARSFDQPLNWQLSSLVDLDLDSMFKGVKGFAERLEQLRELFRETTINEDSIA